MRKSRNGSSSGHLGGVAVGIGIVPPAAAQFDVAARPENDPILREILPPEELAQIAHYRTLQLSKRSRQHSHEQQVQNDKKSELSVLTKIREAKNAASSAPNSRANRGETFRLGKASPLSLQEEADLTGVSGIIDFKEEITKGQVESFEESNVQGCAPLCEEVVDGEKVAVCEIPSIICEEGGTPFFPNALGRNLRPEVPKESGKRRNRSKTQ